MSLKRIIKESKKFKSWIIELLQERGYKVEQLGDDNFLGRGIYSSVYKIDNNKIIKFSHNKNNVQEIDEYKKLVGKSTRHVAKIEYAEYRGNAGIVIMEKLFLSDTHYFINESFVGGDYDLLYLIMKYHIDNPSIQSAPTLLKMIMKDYELSIEDIFSDKENGMVVCKQVLRGLFELDKYNVNYNDIHTDNIMLDRKGNYKIIDFYH